MTAYESIHYVLTEETCPRCKKGKLLKTTRAYSPDDYYNVWVCPKCKEEIAE
jgi:ribosomal protein L37AE/L43A